MFLSLESWLYRLLKQNNAFIVSPFYGYHAGREYSIILDSDVWIKIPLYSRPERYVVHISISLALTEHYEYNYVKFTSF